MDGNINKDKKTSKRLVDKSIEMFLLSIELFNRPTLRNRTEGFSIFICNAWELMLKAHLLEKEGPGCIYFPDKPNRTISLINCIDKVMTNQNDPVRKNLLKICELRNTSTHFITEDYEILYAPLFQSCVTNYSDALFKYHDIAIEDYIPKSGLFLNVRTNAISQDDIKLKYDKPTFEKMLELNQSILSEACQNEKYAVVIKHEIALTKNPEKADYLFRVDSSSKQLGLIIDREVNPLDRCNLTQSKCIEAVNKFIKRRKIQVDFRTTKARNREDEILTEFTTYCFQQYLKAFQIKDNPLYCYKESIHTPVKYSYSSQLIEVICEAIEAHPTDFMNVLEVRIEELEKNKR